MPAGAADQCVNNSQHRHTQKNTPSYGARLDMARIGTTKLATTVYIVNIGSGETSPNKTLVITLKKGKKNWVMRNF